MKWSPNRAPMALTVGVWLCALPFILLLLGPLFGWKVTAIAAGGVLAVLTLICWGICTARATATFAHQGKTYFFCAPSCKATFVKAPEKYVAAPKGGRKGCA